MTRVLTDDFRIAMAREVGRLRYDGWTFERIAERLGLGTSTVHAFAYYTDYQPPAWPSVVTRIERNGYWCVVRDGVRDKPDGVVPARVRRRW